MSQHVLKPSENPEGAVTFMVGKEEKLLGSREAETELEEDSLAEHKPAKEKIDELVAQGYLPVFPLNNVDEIDHVLEHGLAPNRSLVENLKDLRGTIGRVPTLAEKYYLVLVVDEKAAKVVIPRFTRPKDHAFVGGISLSKEVSNESIMVIDPRTFEIVYAPERFKQKFQELQLKIAGKNKSLGSVEEGESVKEKQIDTPDAARDEMKSLLHRGFLPVFPFPAEMLGAVKKHGLDLSESNVVSEQGWRGSLGRNPVKYANDSYWAVVVDEKSFASLEPFEKNPATVALTKSVPKEAVVVIDPETNRIVHAPENAKVEMVKNVASVVGATREQMKKVA